MYIVRFITLKIIKIDMIIWLSIRFNTILLLYIINNLIVFVYYIKHMS